MLFDFLLTRLIRRSAVSIRTIRLNEVYARVNTIDLLSRLIFFAKRLLNGRTGVYYCRQIADEVFVRD